MTIGDRIRNKRTELGITQTDLAKAINVSKQTLYKYENNIITNIPSDKIEKIATSLNVSASYLMGWEEQSKVQKEIIANHFNVTKTDLVETLSTITNPTIIEYYNRLNDEGKAEATKRVEELTFIPRYTVASGNIIPVAPPDSIPDAVHSSSEPTTIAAHFDGEEYTEKELDTAKKFAQFAKTQKK